MQIFVLTFYVNYGMGYSTVKNGHILTQKWGSLAKRFLHGNLVYGAC